MARPIELELRCDLAAGRNAVWSVVSTMDGVNAELHPWIHMTAPAGLVLRADAITPGEVVLRSWLLGLRLLPFDRHSLALVSVHDGHGFVEESHSWMQRRWRHERSVTDTADGCTVACTVTDRLLVEPRLGFTRPLVAAVVRRLFEHRHGRLRARFGTAAQPSTGTTQRNGDDDG